MTHSAAYLREWKRANPARTLIINAKCKAKKTGEVFTLTADDIEVPTHCPILGIELVASDGKGKRSDATPTLRMIDPALGYVPGNVLVISRAAYNARPLPVATWTDAELEPLALDLVRKIGGHGVTPASVAAVLAAFKTIIAKGAA